MSSTTGADSIKPLAGLSEHEGERSTGTGRRSRSSRGHRRTLVDVRGLGLRLGTRGTLVGAYRSVFVVTGMSETLLARLNSARVPCPRVLAVLSRFVNYPFHMSLRRSVSIRLAPKFHRLIRKNVFISCLVTFETPRVLSFRMAFCLHCKYLLSYSGAVKHSKHLVDECRTNLASLFCPEKSEFYKQHILSEIDLHLEMGKFNKFLSSKETSQHDEEGLMQIPFEECQPHCVVLNQVQDDCFRDQPSCSDKEEQEPFPERDIGFEQEWDCIDFFY